VQQRGNSKFLNKQPAKWAREKMGVPRRGGTLVLRPNCGETAKKEKNPGLDLCQHNAKSKVVKITGVGRGTGEHIKNPGGVQKEKAKNEKIGHGPGKVGRRARRGGMGSDVGRGVEKDKMKRFGSEKKAKDSENS